MSSSESVNHTALAVAERLPVSELWPCIEDPEYPQVADVWGYLEVALATKDMGQKREAISNYHRSIEKLAGRAQALPPEEATPLGLLRAHEDAFMRRAYRRPIVQTARRRIYMQGGAYLSSIAPDGEAPEPLRGMRAKVVAHCLAVRSTINHRTNWFPFPASPRERLAAAPAKHDYYYFNSTSLRKLPVNSFHRQSDARPDRDPAIAVVLVAPTIHKVLHRLMPELTLGDTKTQRHEAAVQLITRLIVRETRGSGLRSQERSILRAASRALHSRVPGLD